MKKSQFNRFLSEIGATRAPSNIKDAIRISTVANYIDVISRMSREHRNYSSKSEFENTISLYNNIKKYSYIDPLSSIELINDPDVKRCFRSFSGNYEGPSNSYIKANFLLGIIASANFISETIYSKNAYSLAISEVDKHIINIGEEGFKCSRWGGMSNDAQSNISFIAHSMLFKKSNSLDLDLSEIDTFARRRLKETSGYGCAGLFEYYLIQILKNGSDYIETTLNLNPGFITRTSLYPAIVLSGGLTTKLARKIRSDSSETASLSGLEALFFCGENKYDNYDELLSLFTDTNYEDCAAFLAKNLPLSKLAMLVGSKYGRVKHIISERMSSGD